ncbi:MAG: hypothetical protein ACHWZW_14600 [Spirulina sp.]
MGQHLSAEEQQELEKLRQVIEKAIEDGVVTAEERQQIMAAMRADGQVTYEELALIRQMVCDKVAAGELQAEC